MITKAINEVARKTMIEYLLETKIIKMNSYQKEYNRLNWFGLVWFYGISTFIGYLTPNPFLCK